jgi:uncharacterized membrane protein YphA (DoxX/SURF4 family)
MINFKILISAILLLLLYVVSSIDMIRNFSGTTKIVKKKVGINLPDFLYDFSVICVIVLKTIGSLFILYSIISNKYKNIAYYIVWLFILFTIVATLLFHMKPYNKEKTNLFKNISIIGGFILLSEALKNS